MHVHYNYFVYHLETTLYLPFFDIDSRSTVSTLAIADVIYDYVEVQLPSTLPFGSEAYTTAYVSDMVLYHFTIICRSVVVE